jgi:diaminohydroxyphosphoribosylaminopyrimidine deaminase/5-amino-6-(5-phosphoribosylamino)uracil reductase
VSVTLKLATSLDGRIAMANGESRWITGDAARQAVHRLRAEHDAVVIGIETALADDPELSVRVQGLEAQQPARVVLDSRQRLSPDCKLARSALDVPTFLVALGTPDPALVKRGIRIIQIPPSEEGRPALDLTLKALAKVGLSRLMVEGGGQDAGSFLKGELVDAIEWFRAPLILGAEGRPAVGNLALATLAVAPHFKRTEIREVGNDLWERYKRT